jgi:four helix bundle protein
LKEANETEYWLMLLKDTDYITELEYASLFKDRNELVKMLFSSIKTL